MCLARCPSQELLQNTVPTARLACLHSHLPSSNPLPLSQNGQAGGVSPTQNRTPRGTWCPRQDAGLSREGWVRSGGELGVRGYLQMP